MPNTKTLYRQLKQIDKELKTLNQRRDGAYEMAINDKGAALKRVQAEIDKVLARRSEIVKRLRAAGVR